MSNRYCFHIFADNSVSLPKSGEGIFSWISSPLPSNFYTYNVYIDGIRVCDPNNVYHIRDVASLNNYFIIGGGTGDLFEVQDAKQFQHAPKLYWMACGKADSLFGDNLAFCRKLDGLGARYTFVETEGGHTWQNWRTYLTQFVPLLFK